MEWRPDPERDGLRLERPPSTLEGVRFRDARRRFIASRGGDATTRMANGLTAGVLRRFLHRETVEQFSKWRTEWHGERGERTFAGSVPAAARLSDVLFGRVVPRLRTTTTSASRTRMSCGPTSAAASLPGRRDSYRPRQRA